MNYFGYPTAAERYARGRPYFQPLVVERVKRVCCPDDELDRALDVGCGTGQSTVALAAIAKEVVGADASIAMLKHAQRHPRVSYARGRAEGLPFRPVSFDLITVGLAFHWFDRQRFLHEAKRVLRHEGWLVIFDDQFSGRMNENEEYALWNKEHYARRFPAPPRNTVPFTDDDAHNCGFAPRAHERFTHTVTFTPEQLVSYLLTHSNVIAAAEGGTEDIQSIAGWLGASIRPLFKSEVAEFPFNCVLDIFQRQREN